MPSASKTAPAQGVQSAQQPKDSAAVSKPSKKSAAQDKASASSTTSTKTARRSKEKKDKKQANGEVPATNGVVAAPVSEEQTQALTKPEKKKKKKKSKKESALVKQEASAWKISPYLGGRYSDRDPVFSKDERHLFVAHSNVLKVFSTKSSLLVRSFTAPSIIPEATEKVVGYCLDPTSEDGIYVTTQSQIFLWNWMTGELLHKWSPMRNQKDVFVAPDTTEPGVIFVMCGRSLTPEGRAIWRLKLSTDSATSVEKELVFKTEAEIPAVRVADSGNAVCAISDKNLLIANRSAEGEWSAPRRYPMPQTLTTMDIFVSTIARKGKKAPLKTGHVVVGDVAGALYVLHDVVLRKPQETPASMKLHWHRRAVSAAKWALDGTYIISGGSETVLVIWQLETGHKQFLPHLGAAINNIVVSPNATSYAVSLSDNSVMVLSTTELKPTANIAGIQSLAAPAPSSTEIPRTPCTLHPTLANRLLLAAPSDQLDPQASAPYLQTFDTSADRHIARQAVARTNATNLNTGPDNLPISESDITHIALSPDGQWLATVDTWTPPSTPSTTLTKIPAATEVFLKFWQWTPSSSEWTLITRVDNPHPSEDTTGAQPILSLISSPTTSTFITTGADGLTKLWAPKTRHRPGATTQGLITWSNRRTIPFSKPLPLGRPWWGATAISPDSSVLAVACPDPGFAPTDDSQIHLISPATGSVHLTLGGLHLGRVLELAILERNLIILASSKLVLYNLVTGRIAHEANITDLADDNHVLLPDASLLAVDPVAENFAVAISQRNQKETVNAKVFVFTTNMEVLCAQTLSAAATALKHAPAVKGYMVLDAQARVRFISPEGMSTGGDGAAQKTVAEVESRIAELYLGVAAKPERREEGGDVEMVDGEESGAIVGREELGKVWDEVPTYAMGPVEEAFERVYGMFAKRPYGGEEEEVEEAEVNEAMLIEN